MMIHFFLIRDECHDAIALYWVWKVGIKKRAKAQHFAR